MAVFLDTIPENIREVYLSDEYDTYIDSLVLTYALNDEKQGVLQDIIRQLWSKRIAPEKLSDVLRSELGLTAEEATPFAKSMFANIVVLFPEYFGDQTKNYIALGGAMDKFYEESILAGVLLRYYNDQIRPYTDRIAAIDLDIQAHDAVKFFSEGIVGTIAAPDGIYKASFNDLLIGLLASSETYYQELLQALYENKELIGAQSILLDGKRAEQSVENWIKDVMSFTGGEITTISLSKYLSESGNVRQLTNDHREVLRKLLEVFRILKNFPASFEKVPPDQWMVIPYKREGIITIESRPNLEAPIADKNIPAPIPVESFEVILPKEQRSIPTPPQISQDAFLGSAVQIMTSSGIAITDPQIYKRVQNGLVTRLKDVRDAFELKAFLVQAIEMGGAGLPEATADRLVSASTQALTREQGSDVKKAVPIRPQEKVVPLPTRPSPPPKSSPAPRSIPSIKPPRLEIKEVDGVPTLVEKEMAVHIKSLNPAITPPMSQSVPVSSPKTPFKKPTLSRDEVVSIPVSGMAVPSSPHTMHIERGQKSEPPKPMDPIEELRAFTLVDFRRLNPDPYAASKRIYQIVQLLEKESFAKKQAAVKAWHESEVGKLYEQIGQEVFMRNVPIEQIIASREERKLPFLNAKEMDALMELSEMIRF